MFSNFALTALSPLDGRYHSQLIDLCNLFSEYALIRQRVRVEIAYLLFLAEQGCISPFTKKQQEQLLRILTNFNEADALRIKELEKETKHDVKAVEYFLREKMEKLELPSSALVHLALTSEDVNSLAYSLMVKESVQEVLVPALHTLLSKLSLLAEEHFQTPMLARTHGQAAVPTTVGKEVVVFASRLLDEVKVLRTLPIEAKLTGAVGNFNAHVVAFPEHNWTELSADFVSSFDLVPNLFTTQVLPAESYNRVFAVLQRINGILLDCSQDFWRYISDGVFIQKKEKGQVGSSTMPQKVNPIEFENAEGNLGLANALLIFFVQKLSVSRLQRDLSDSTVKRSIGSAFGYCLLAYNSLAKGLGKISVNQEKLINELDTHWEVLAEAVQVVLRQSGQPDGYEKLKSFSQGKQLTQPEWQRFVESLEIPSSIKKQLHRLTPQNYIGVAPQLTKAANKRITTYLKGVS
ncbi:adenylosuccinate lyase [Patescibacteria group bacterium]|nr:adenylosuccinate lyase [Patescibacteria group bacterium]